MIINKKRVKIHEWIINLILICTMSICLVFGIHFYSQSNKHNVDSDIYLTITENSFDGNELSSMVAKITEKNEIEHLFTLKHNAQYSLTCYDKANKKVYYMDNENDERHGGDQLFYYDLKSGKIEQITKELFGANYIIPVDKNKVFMVVAKKDTHTLEPIYVSIDSGKVIDIKCDDDLFINVANKDNSQGEFYISGYSNSEDYKMLDKCNSTDEEQMYGIDNTVYKVQDNHIKKVFTLSDRFIDSFAVNGQNIICNTSLRGTGSDYDYKSYLFDISTLKLTELKVKINGNIFALDDQMNVLINTGSEIKRINIKTGDEEVLLKIDPSKAWINNANNYQ